MEYYIAIDLKSFYAAVECEELGLDIDKTNLVVADENKTDKTICLAVSPSFKKMGISGRPRLFEVKERVKEINLKRKAYIGGMDFVGKSYYSDELSKNPFLELTFIAAPPRMSLYIEYSTRIYEVYLRYAYAKDMHVYSIDEIFIKATSYLNYYGLTAKEMATMIIRDVIESTGIMATAGVGSNMYLAKIAMDIGAKHAEADEDGIRVAELDEMSYRRFLWDHKPITDFWRVGHGMARRLARVGIYTMGEVARCSVGRADQFHNEDLLYELFGVNAELLIDHAWGYEPVDMDEVKGYVPENSSVSNGQVLLRPYGFDEGRIVLKEMLEGLAMDLTKKGLLASQVVIMVGYDVENVDRGYKGDTKVDLYGRVLPKKTRGTVNLGEKTASVKLITDAVVSWYDNCVDRNLTLRRFTISANSIVREDELKKKSVRTQMNFFDYSKKVSVANASKRDYLIKENKLQSTILEIHRKFGKNSLLRGMSLQDGATKRIRNESIGGHRA